MTLPAAGGALSAALTAFLPFGLAPGTAAALGLGLLGAAFVRGFSGFGFSAVFIAWASLWTNPLPLIPVVFACEIAMTGFQARGIGPWIDWRRVGTVMAGATLAIPMSVGVLTRLGEETVRMVVAGVILVLAILLAVGATPGRPLGGAERFGVGLVAGIANGAGVGGLPVAAALGADAMQAAAFRATLIVIVTGLDLVSLPVMGIHGLVGVQTLAAALVAFPLLALGVWLGSRFFGRASDAAFRRVVILLLAALAALSLIRGVLS